MATRGATAGKSAPKPRVRNRNGALSDDARACIVTRLALYDHVADIQRGVAERWGVEVTHQAITHYNPEHNATLARRWIELFHDTRRKLHDELAAEPLTNRMARVRRLTRLHDEAFAKALEGGADRLAHSEEARTCLEQIAKEVGGLLTNQRHLTGRVDHTHTEITPEERRNVLEDRLLAALAQRKKTQPTVQ